MNSIERKTVSKMISLYCHAKHATRHTFCESCSELNEYAQLRLSKCIYGDNKLACKKCPVHCYSPAMKIKIKEVMRYAGPRMLLYNPLLAVIHLVGGLRKRSV